MNSRIRGHWLFAVVILLITTSGCSLTRPPVPDKLPIHSALPVSGELLAGAAKIDITPGTVQYMGGFKPNRKSMGVNDPLFASAVVLEQDGVRLALVSVDLVGMMRPEIEEAKKLCTEIDPRFIIITSTHNHHSPDTMGLWGIPPFKSGIDPDYMKQVQQGIATAVSQAIDHLRPAELGAQVVAVNPENFFKNSSRPGLVDPEVAVLHLRERNQGATIAIVTELGCHPEVVNRRNRLITSDFPNWTRKALEFEFGGVPIYVSGALGALVAPQLLKYPDQERSKTDWIEVERIGNELASVTARAVRSLGEHDTQPVLRAWHTEVYLKNENFYFKVARAFRLVKRPIYGKGYFATEVNLWQLGDLVIATVPGEISPDLGLRIKEMIGPKVMIIGLANDELGYLLPEWDYEMAWYDYERTLCIGKEAATRIMERLRDLSLLNRYMPAK